MGFFLLFPGIKNQGFLEADSLNHSPDTDKKKKKESGPLIRREHNIGVSTELSFVMNLEEKKSSELPWAVQFIWRGVTRLNIAKELSARLPSIVFSVFLLLIIFVTLRKYLPSGAVYTSIIVVATSPLFISGGRTVFQQIPWFFFSTLSILFLFISSEIQTKNWKFFSSVLLSGIFLFLSFTSGGIVLGVSFPLMTAGAYFIASRSDIKVYKNTGFYLSIIASLIIAYTLFTIGSGKYSLLLFETVNPARVTPTGKLPHAVFFTQLSRIAFSMLFWFGFFVVSIISIGTKPEEYNSGKPEGRISLLMIWWSVISFFFAAYYEMRTGDVVAPFFIPAGILTGTVLWKTPKVFFTGKGALVLAAVSILILRDIRQYPETLVETSLFIELNKMTSGPGRLIYLPFLVTLFPIIYILFAGRKSMLNGIYELFRKIPDQSHLGWLLKWLFWPLNFLLKLLNKYMISRLFLFFERKIQSFSVFWKKYVPVHFLTFSIVIGMAVFGVYYSFKVIPSVHYEFSSRSIYNKFNMLNSGDESLGVWNMSGLASTVYTGKKSKVILNDDDLDSFMKSEKNVYLGAPLNELGKFDYLSRKRKFPYIMVSKPAPRYMLLSNRKDSKNFNPLSSWVFDKPQKSKFQIDTVFEKKVKLIGYDLPRKINRGDDFNIRLQFEVNGHISTEYKIFIHLDPPYGTRITGDHNPIKGLLPTRYWSSGTFVIDDYTIKIPRYGFPKGNYRVFAGLFHSSKRMKITSGKNGGENRAPLGYIEIGDSSFFSCR
ncbi:MAG: glycosyltransferase family 39 protein [Deltaproteobacteria bacterium]|nr:glycosyltransferase family 39 protein [Deltaproteobacteria bacterium]